MKNVVPYLNIQAHGNGSAMEGAPDQGLLRQKGGRGFPYCTLMNASGDVIWEARPTSQGAFDTAVKNATWLQQLQVKAAEKPDDAGLKASATLLAGMGYDQRQGKSIAELTELCDVEGIDAKVVAQFKTWRVGAEVMSALRSRQGPQKTYEMFKAGTKLPEDFGFAEYFYMYATRGAIMKKDRKTAMAAVEKLAAVVEAKGDARMKSAVETLKKQAAGLPDGE